MDDIIVEVDALLERMYWIKDAELADRWSMNAARKLVLYYHGMGVVGNSDVLKWVVGGRHRS